MQDIALTGLDLIRKIKILKQKMPCILCTGYNENISKEALREIGIDEVLMKPFSIEVLASKIRKLLDLKNV